MAYGETWRWTNFRFFPIHVSWSGEPGRLLQWEASAWHGITTPPLSHNWMELTSVPNFLVCILILREGSFKSVLLTKLGGCLPPSSILGPFWIQHGGEASVDHLVMVSHSSIVLENAPKGKEANKYLWAIDWFNHFESVEGCHCLQSLKESPWLLREI